MAADDDTEIDPVAWVLEDVIQLVDVAPVASNVLHPAVLDAINDHDVETLACRAVAGGPLVHALALVLDLWNAATEPDRGPRTRQARAVISTMQARPGGVEYPDMADVVAVRDWAGMWLANSTWMHPAGALLEVALDRNGVGMDDALVDLLEQEARS